MRVLLFLFLVSGVFASYSEYSLYLPKTVNTTITEYQLEYARISLIERPKKIDVSYGDGALSNQLEMVTKNLLSYAWLYNIVHTLTDEFEAKPKRARILVSLKNRELRFSYAF